MRQAHITYLRSLAAGLILNGTQPFQAATDPTDLAQARFLEIEPAANRFQELVPFCVLSAGKPQNIRDGRRIRKLGLMPQAEPVEGEITPMDLVYLRQHFKQRFPYTLTFWLEDPAADVLSSAEPLPVDEPEDPEAEVPEPALHSYGLIDQALLYIASHEYFANEVSGTVRVVAGDSGMVSDPVGELALYKLYLEIIFEDGLQAQEHIPTLAGAAFSIRNTTVEAKI